MPARLFYDVSRQALPALPPIEGMAMTMDIEPAANESSNELSREMAWLIGHDFHSGKFHAGKAATESRGARLVWLAIIAVAGMATWMTFPGPSGAQSQSVPAAAPVTALTAPATAPTQSTSLFNPAITPTVATLAAAPAEEIKPAEITPVDGLSISSQSWRRGGLGSKALVTFTLRNGNDYAVRDVEISCAFTRRDGSHLTDRRRTIRDIVINMKSRKIFARMHVGFVNVNADKAKCLPLSASRI
jgi:hypothetical protein